MSKYMIEVSIKGTEIYGRNGSGDFNLLFPKVSSDSGLVCKQKAKSKKCHSIISLSYYSYSVETKVRSTTVNNNNIVVRPIVKELMMVG